MDGARSFLSIVAATLLWAAPPSESHAQAGQDGAAPGNEAKAENGIETEDLFGFTAGSDTAEAGSKGLAFETVATLGKRAGSYRALGQKLEFGFGAVENLSLAFSLLGDYHRVRNVPGLDDIGGRYAFNGFGGELRWRFLDRRTVPFGLTLQVEPSISRIDDGSGQSGRKIGSENKLILDRELVPNTLFGAVNLLYDVERMRERRAGFVAEREANAGIGGALAYRLTEALFLGVEARYLRAYEGFALEKFQGQALFVGPTLFARVLDKGWISAAWNVQVRGREAIDRAARAEAIAGYHEGVEAALAAGDPLPLLPTFGRRGRYDLANFERHQLKLKAGFEF
jgi:hypothetical protein